MSNPIVFPSVQVKGQPGELLGRGRTAEVYRWGEQGVVKLFYPFMPPAAVEHEACVAAALARVKLPAPRYYGRIQVEDRLGLLFERIDGRYESVPLSSTTVVPTGP